MNLAMWIQIAMQRHLALVVDDHAFVGQDAAFDDSIHDALDSIAACEVEVVVIDRADITWGELRDQVAADTIIALADPDRHPHLFQTIGDHDRRDVAIAVRGRADARGWLSGSLSVREFVRWLIAVRTGWMVRAPRFDVGWA